MAYIAGTNQELVLGGNYNFFRLRKIWKLVKGLCISHIQKNIEINAMLDDSLEPNTI